MLQILKNLLGLGPKPNFKELVNNGAQIIDVRTPAEFKGGHIKGSKNMPLDSLRANVGKLKKDKPVITCCASGMRSASAKGIFVAKGFKEVYNGGAWTSLEQQII